MAPVDGLSVAKARNQMLESQKRKGGLADGEKSPSSAKKPRNLTSLLPFGKKKNVIEAPNFGKTRLNTGGDRSPVPASANDSEVQSAKSDNSKLSA